MLVNDSQCPPVLGAFVTVTFHQGADGVGAAELLGQLLQAGAGDQDPPAARGLDEVPGGEGFQRLVHRGPGQPGRGGEVEAALRPAAGVFEGFVDERGGVARVPGTPGAARAVSRACQLTRVARAAISSGMRSWYRSPARPRSFSIRSISGSSSSRRARRWAATVVWSSPVAIDRDRVPNAMYRDPVFIAASPIARSTQRLPMPARSVYRVVLEQAERGPPGAEPLVLGRCSAGSLLILIDGGWCPPV